MSKQAGKQKGQGSAVKKVKISGVTVAGISIVLFTVLLLLFFFFLPRWRENHMLSESTDLILTAELDYMAVADPLRRAEGVFTDRGVEVILEDAEVEAVREALQAVVDGGFRNGENETLQNGAWDLNLTVRTADNKRTTLYFTETALYFYAETTAYYFTPKDAAAFAALRTLLCDLVTA